MYEMSRCGGVGQGRGATFAARIFANVAAIQCARLEDVTIPKCIA